MLVERPFRTVLAGALLVACSSGTAMTGAPEGTPEPEEGPTRTQPSGAGGAGSDDGASANDAGARAGDADVPGADAAAPGDPFEPGPPHVQLIGRFDTSDPSRPRCALAGCRIVARFHGTEASAVLKEQYFDWMEAAPSEWDVVVDGVVTKKLVMAHDETTFVLASGLPAGDHVVELYKRTEAISGTTEFVGFDFAGGALLAPPARKTRRIEVVGDSASTGFGIEGVGFTDAGDCPGPDHAAKWENFHEAYGALLGDLLGAEVVADVHSGKGISKNIWRPDTETLPVLFMRTLPDEPAAWSFASWKADVVVVMAGSNDFSVGEPVDDGPATLADFTAAYGQFVTTIRTQYPQAHVVLAIAPSLDDRYPDGRSTRTNVIAGAHAVVDDRNAKGDTKTWFFEPNKADPSELTACLGHGNTAYHQRVANELAAFIAPKLGW